MECHSCAIFVSLYACTLRQWNPFVDLPFFCGRDRCAGCAVLSPACPKHCCFEEGSIAVNFYSRVARMEEVGEDGEEDSPVSRFPATLSLDTIKSQALNKGTIPPLQHRTSLLTAHRLLRLAAAVLSHSPPESAVPGRVGEHRIAVK